MDESYLFRAKTHEGFIFKILVELLQQIIKSACFFVNKDGIFLRMFDSNCCIMIDLELNAGKFNTFELGAEDLYIGLNLTHLYRMLKSLKKKDSLMLYITHDEPDTLQFLIHPQDNNRKIHSTIQIQSMQSITCKVPTGYSHPVIISSAEFYGAMKDMCNINNSFTIEMRNSSLSVACASNKICSRRVEFGEMSDASPTHTSGSFEMELFNRVIKISGLCKYVHVQYNQGNPLHVYSNVGQLGRISIYLKQSANEGS